MKRRRVSVLSACTLSPLLVFERVCLIGYHSASSSESDASVLLNQPQNIAPLKLTLARLAIRLASTMATICSFVSGSWSEHGVAAAGRDNASFTTQVLAQVFPHGCCRPIAIIGIYTLDSLVCFCLYKFMISNKAWPSWAIRGALLPKLEVAWRLWPFPDCTGRRGSMWLEKQNALW